MLDSHFKTRSPRHCPSCKGKEFEPGKQRDQRSVGEYTFEAELPMYRCKSCGQILLELEEIGRFERGIAGWLARHGVLSGEAFRFMRKSIGLRANELADLLDLTPETLSRWEKEHRQPDRKAMVVLGAIVLDRLQGEDFTLNRLQLLRSSPPGREHVDLTHSLYAP